MDRRAMSRQYKEAAYAPIQYGNRSGMGNSKQDFNNSMTSSITEGMPKTILDRLHDRRSRFAGINLSERDIEEILGDAATTLDLDLSGASLVEDIPFFIADSISRNSYFDFVHINLNSTSISQRGYEIMMELIAQCRDLETLSLRNNALQQDAGMALAKIVGAKGRLRILDVTDNFLGDAGLAVIAGALTADLSSTKHIRSSLLSLEVLDLTSNHIGDNGLLALCRGLIHFSKHLAAIDKVSSLKVLKLDKNNLGEKSALCLSQLFQTCRELGSLSIEELSLDDNPIGPPGISALFHAVARRAMQKTGDSAEEAAYDFENNLIEMKKKSGNYDPTQPDPSLRGGTLMVLSLNRCRPDLSVLEEFSSLLRHGSLLKSLDMTMTRHVARDVSQQPGFVETIITLTEAVANNVFLQTLELGDLCDVCNTAAVIAAPNSYQLASIKRGIDGLNSIKALLKLETAQQRLNWYAKHYYGGSDDRSIDHMEALSPLKSEEAHKRSESEVRRNEVSDPSRSARKNEVLGSGATEAISLHRAEYEKIRRDHVDTFSELSHQIQELQHAKLKAVEDMHSNSFDDESRGRQYDSRGRSGLDSDRSRSRSASPNRSDGRPPLRHSDDRSEDGSQTYAASRGKMPGLHYSHPRSTGSSDRPRASSPTGSQSVRSRSSPERRRADGTRLYDESSVQALIKAAVNSALQFSEKNGRSAGVGGSPDHTMQNFGGSLGNTGNTEPSQAASAAQNDLVASRLSIMEDRIEGIEVQQLGQMSDTVPMEKFLAVQSLAAKLEGRLKVVEEYMVRTDAEKKLEDEKNKKDQTALKEYIIKMEENQRALLARLEELEITLEGDSQTSIGLLDILLKKIGAASDNNAVQEAEVEEHHYNEDEYRYQAHEQRQQQRQLSSSPPKPPPRQQQQSRGRSNGVGGRRY